MNASDPLLESAYIGGSITVAFDNLVFLTKKPDCPQQFTWQGQVFVVAEVLSAWQDFERRGKLNRNMQAAHAARARVTGSLGVGKFYFRIMTADRRFFELYYDRTIKNAHARGGSWVLYREIFNYRDPEK